MVMGCQSRGFRRRVFLPRQAALAGAFAHVAHRFVKTAVRPEVRIADDAVDHQRRFFHARRIGIGALVEQRPKLILDGANLVARVEGGLGRVLELLERHPAKLCVGREVLLRADEGLKLRCIGAGCVWHGRNLVLVWRIMLLDARESIPKGRFFKTGGPSLATRVP